MKKKVPLGYESESQSLKRVQGSFDLDPACIAQPVALHVATNTRSQFFARALHSGASIRRPSTSHFFPLAGLARCCAVACRCPHGERIPTLDPFPPCHPLQPRMACCNRHVKCATYACDPISSAARAVCVCSRVEICVPLTHLSHIIVRREASSLALP